MKAELFNYTCWVGETDSAVLRQRLEELLNRSAFEVLGFMDHHFTPQGYTCIWLLGESHLAVHTYPEESKSYIELTSCVKEKNELFQKLLCEAFVMS